MKTVFKFLFGQKNEPIGLSSFRGTKPLEKTVNTEKKSEPTKTALTGMIRRAG